MLIILMLTFLPLLANPCHSFLTMTQCVDLGEANNYWYYFEDPNEKDPKHQVMKNPKARLSLHYRHGSWSIGTRKFNTKFNFLDEFGRQTINFVNTAWDSSEPDYRGFDAKQDIKPKSYSRRRRHLFKTTTTNTSKRPRFKRGVRQKRQTQKPYYFKENQIGITPCPYSWNPYDSPPNDKVHYWPSVDFCPSDKDVQIRTYAVQEKQTERILQGWLYVEVELKDENDEILAIYVQMMDEEFNAVGQFVTDPQEQCPEREDTQGSEIFGQPTAYQVLPCSAVGFREVKVSQAVFMVRRQALYDDQLVKSEHLPEDDQPKKGVRFTWRMSEYWCNRHLRIRPEAIIYTKKMWFADEGRRYMKPLILRKTASYWLLHKYYGTADLKLPGTTLRCDKPAIDYLLGDIYPDNAPWLAGSVPSILENDYMHSNQWIFHPYFSTWQLKGCNTNPFQTYVWNQTIPSRLPPLANSPDSHLVPSFIGRCPHQYRKDNDPQLATLQSCKRNESGPEFTEVFHKHPKMPKYTEFLKELQANRSKYCNLPCVSPTLQDLPSIQMINDTSADNLRTRYYQFATENRKRKKMSALWYSRKHHAVLCIYWTMFFIPVGIFMARYMKETFMKNSCSLISVWFWVHIATSLGGMAFFICGLAGVWSPLQTFGRSSTFWGQRHKELGYVSFTFFVLMILLGGFRYGEDVLDMWFRKYLLVAHCLMGFLIYFLNLGALLTSVNIPASPSMGDKCDNEGSPTDHSAAYGVMIAWISIDAVLHLGMNGFQFLVDLEFGIKRKWWFPLIPMLPFNSAKDFKGSGCRRVMAYFYVACAFTMSTATASLIMAHAPKNRTCLELTGPSTCTEVWGCSSEAKMFAEFYIKNARFANKTWQIHLPSGAIENRSVTL